MTAHPYTQACEDAATRQGLDPITDALRAAGIPHVVDQTGGFTMCVHVPLDEGDTSYLYLTDDQGGVLIGRYWNCEDWHSEGEDTAPVCALDEVAGIVRAHIADPRPCPYRGEPWHQ